MISEIGGVEQVDTLDATPDSLQSSQSRAFSRSGT